MPIDSKEEYGGPERRHEHWHLRKEINVGHMISTIMLMVAAFTWSSNIDKRVTVLETRQEQQSQQTTEMRAELRTELRTLNDKLDKLIERELDRNGKH